MVPNVHRPPPIFHFLFHFKMEIFYGPVFCISVGSQIRPRLPCTFHSGPHTTTTTNHKTISAPPRNLGGRPPAGCCARASRLREGRAAWRRERERRAHAHLEITRDYISRGVRARSPGGRVKMKIQKVSWSQMSMGPPRFSIFFSISKWKYFMVPFRVFLSGHKIG